MTNQNRHQQTPDTVDEKPAKDILSLVLSFIGLGRSTGSRDDDSSRSLYSSSFSSTSSSSSTKVASTSSRSSSSSSSSYYTYDDVDQSTLYYTEGTMSTSSLSPSTPTTHTNNNKTIDESTVFVPSAATSDKQPLYDTWAFQDWLQRLPKLALFHLVSTTAMQDPMVAYYLLEYQYNDDTTTNGDDNDKDDDLHLSCNDTTTTRLLLKEIKWIQRHARAILHQLDPLRPNEQFAKAKDIADRLFSMLQLCEQHFYDHWGDSWLTVMSLVLVAQECFDGTPAEIRQYLFYRAKLGRTVVLKMNAALKHYKVWKKDHHAQCHQRDTTPQQYVAHHFFSTTLQQQDDTLAAGWRCALETICNQLARLDDGWAFKDEYQQAVTLAANIVLE